MSKNIVFIGEGPLFNNCLKFFFELYKKDFFVITKKSNKKKLNFLKKSCFKNFHYLDKIRDIKFLFSIMNEKIIKKNILKKSEFSLNFHDGPLPKYGGRYSSTWAILNGEDRHGCCWHLIDQNIDTGKIIKKKIFKIEEEDTSYSVDLKSLFFGLQMFKNIAINLINKKQISGCMQNLGQRSYYGLNDLYRIPILNDITLTKMTLKEILNFSKALNVSEVKRNYFLCPKIFFSKDVLKIKKILIFDYNNFEIKKNLTNSFFLIKDKKIIEFQLSKINFNTY